jgi:hypothetical protein
MKTVIGVMFHPLDVHVSEGRDNWPPIGYVRIRLPLRTNEPDYRTICLSWTRTGSFLLTIIKTDFDCC